MPSAALPARAFRLWRATRAIRTSDAVLGAHRIDSVVHFAARKSVAESVRDPLGYYRSNLGSVISLAAAAIDHRIARLSSSATVYGSTSALPVTEGSPTVPESPYGETKLMYWPTPRPRRR